MLGFHDESTSAPSTILPVSRPGVLLYFRIHLGCIEANPREQGPVQHIKYDRRQVTRIDKGEILAGIQASLRHHGQVELSFAVKPPPEVFRQLLLDLQSEVSPEQWFLSEEDSVIAGVLWNLNFSRPRRAVIEIANGCNLKCDFCWTHSPLLDNPPDAKWLKKTLSSDLIKSYLDDLASFGTVRLVEFCAIGDPLYHPDIWQLIEHAKQKGFFLRLSTNGTLLLPTKWDRHCAEPVNELFMNISAGDRATYADIHNVAPQIFDQLMLNLQHIDADRKRRGLALSMRWINIITNKNIGNIDRIVDSGLAAGADYFDFRYVWVHQEFQRKIGVTRDRLDETAEDLLRVGARIRALGIASNFDEFCGAYLGSVKASVEAAPLEVQIG